MTFDECIKYVEDHLEVRYATKCGAYTSGKTITPNGCVNHSLGVAQPSVDNVFEAMNNPNSGYGVHAILGDFHKGEGRILQTLPFNYRPWGCGSGNKGSFNATRLQWEICEPAGHTYNGGTMINYSVEKNMEYFNRMKKMLIAWNVYCAYKFKYGVSMINDHSESYALGYATNHADVMHWFPKHGYSMDKLRADVKSILDEKTSKGSNTIITASDLAGLSESEVVEKMGPLFTEEQERSGILADVIFAQFILESGYGHTELATKSNNCFGMKATLSGNLWSGSSWDGTSTCEIITTEYYSGNYVKKLDVFRKYNSINESIADHSAYLLGAKRSYSDSEYRYQGLSGCKDEETAIRIIKDGGYATDPEYVSKLMNIITKWNLNRFNAKNMSNNSKDDYPTLPFYISVNNENYKIYSKAKSDSDVVGTTRKGIFTIIKISNNFGLLKSYSDDENGWVNLKDTNSYSITIPDNGKVPYMVRITTSNLRIRTGPGTTYPTQNNLYTGVGVFTIVDEKAGTGSDSGWGLLKSYEQKRDGWISLDYTEKL